MLDMSEYYALFIQDELLGVFEEFRECLVWCSEYHPGKEVLVKRVRKIADRFSVFEIPIQKIELRSD